MIYKFENDYQNDAKNAINLGICCKYNEEKLESIIGDDFG